MFAIVCDIDDELINSLLHTVTLDLPIGRLQKLCLPQNSMDRLEFISMTEPELAVKTSEFLERFPEFQKYRSIACSTKCTVKFNEDWEPKTLFEHVIYYICAAGVRYTYAVEQYKKIVSFLRSDTWHTINANLYNFLNTAGIQQRKKEIYWSIFCWMGSRGIYNSTLTVEKALEMKNDIKGLGDGYYANIKGQFTQDDDCIEFTDIGFIKGFLTLYCRNDKPFMMSKVREYISTGYGRIANNFIFQIFHYGSQIG